MSSYFMKQCHLMRRTDKGITYTTSWLPEKFAIKDKYVKLFDTNDWVDGWKILVVSPTRYRSDVINERSQDYKKTRSASDV